MKLNVAVNCICVRTLSLLFAIQKMFLWCHFENDTQLLHKDVPHFQCFVRNSLFFDDSFAINLSLSDKSIWSKRFLLKCDKLILKLPLHICKRRYKHTVRAKFRSRSALCKSTPQMLEALSMPWRDEAVFFF